MTDTDVRTAGRPRSERARAATLEAAGELLDERGLAALSVDAIATRAGVSKATIYRWWPSKGAVVMDAFLERTSPHDAVPRHGVHAARTCAGRCAA